MLNELCNTRGLIALIALSCLPCLRDSSSSKTNPRHLAPHSDGLPSCTPPHRSTWASPCLPHPPVHRCQCRKRQCRPIGPPWRRWRRRSKASTWATCERLPLPPLGLLEHPPSKGDALHNPKLCVSLRLLPLRPPRPAPPPPETHPPTAHCHCLPAFLPAHSLAAGTP